MKIFLVDHHRMMRDGLKAILEKERFQVVGEADTCRQAIALVRCLQPNVVVMDISTHDLNATDATRTIMAETPATKVIGLSMNADRRNVVAMFKAGAVGYLLKKADSEELIQAVRAVTAGLTYISPSIASVVGDTLYDDSANTATAEKMLSARERQVLQLVAEGKSSKEIGSHLDIAVSTVETHRRHLMDKLNLRTVAELTKYAVRDGLITVD